MNALVTRFTHWFGSHLRVTDKRVREPEAAEKSRPMTGLWATLSPEQKARARAYDGVEAHGDPQYANKR